MKILGLLFGLLISTLLIGQGTNKIHNNTFLIKNYQPKDYNANPQIFSITQDHRGVMYFANQLGVLEYDGTNWRTIKTNGKEVQQIAINNKGVIYVLCDGEIGILSPDANGELKYESIIHLFSSLIKNNSFTIFSQILFLDEDIFIKTKDELFKINGDSVIKTQSTNAINFIQKIGKVIYVDVDGIGLHTLKNNTLHLIKNGSDFSNRIIINILSFNKETYVVTKENGVFRFTETNTFEYITSVRNSSITSASNNLNHFLVFGTSEGIKILDNEFTTIKQIGLNEGIINPYVSSQLIDNEGILWVGTNGGISKIEINTPIEMFDKNNGIIGVEDVESFNNTIFCATQNGVYYLKPNGETEKINNINSDCYGLLEITLNGDPFLLVAEVNGIYLIDKEFNAKHISEGGPYMFKESPINSNDFFAIHYDGISNLKFEKGNLYEDNYIKNFCKGEPYNFIIQNNGTIWIGTLDDGIYQTTTDSYTKIKDYIHYDLNSGIPEGPSYLFEHDNRIYAGTDLGLYILEGNKFIPSNKFNLGSKKQQIIHRINKDENGKIWAILIDKENNYEVGYSLPTNEGYKWKTEDFIKYSDEVIHGFYHDSNGFSWLGGPNGLIKYDNNYIKKPKQNFNTLIRTISQGDSVLYNGYKKGQNQLEINFSGNTPLTFEYASASFIDESKTVFSYYLEGHDKTWSEWSNRNIKEYNLYEGTYVFKVKAKNILGSESNIASYSINVLPPWYRTLLAFIIYIILFLIVIYIAIKLSVLRVKKINEKLEQTVKLRTKEVVKQKAEAEKQRDLVHEKNEEITDSINYAKRLQDAILPSFEEIDSLIPNNFILYKPKDLVSGDFYWSEKMDDYTYLASADCTGHGVPGAMVSVVCSNALNRSVKEFGISEPSKILNKTRELVIETFAKSGEDVKDGMDIALCAFSNNKVIFSGANNPLWIIRRTELLSEEQKEARSSVLLNNFSLIEFKSNKQPIGLYEGMKDFTQEEILLNTDDTLYFFTDGYPDQFGGEKGKKFKYKPFKKLLLEIHTESMTKQKSILDKTFETWKGNLDQIDDVCVIGVKL